MASKVCLDASTPNSGINLAKANVGCVMRYLSSVKGPKVLTAGEYNDLIEHGVAVGLVYEDNTLDMNGGPQAGNHHALVASWEAGALGWPSGSGIYFACDTPTPPPHTGVTMAAIAPVIRGHGWRVGWYGNADAGRLLMVAGYVDLIWAVDTWGSRKLDYCHLAQRANHSPVQITGVTYDYNTVLTADFGQNPRPAPIGWAS